MALVASIALGYLVLLLLAGILAGSLCRVAKLSARHGQTARGEVVLWGSIAPFGETTPFVLAGETCADCSPVGRKSTRSRAA